jgi:hypothetical protein
MSALGPVGSAIDLDAIVNECASRNYLATFKDKKLIDAGVRGIRTSVLYHLRRWEKDGVVEEKR